MPARCTWPTLTSGAGAGRRASSGSSRQCERGSRVSGYAVQQVVEVVLGEAPVEGLGHGVVALLEGSQASRDGAEVEEIVGGNDFSLDHGEVDSG